MPPTDWRALKAQVRIVYLDRDLVVAEKPAGLSTVRYHGPDVPRGRSRDEPPVLAEILPPLIRAREGPRAAKGRPRPLRVVQRLDIGTSGLIVFARTPDAERELGNQFRKHSVQRSYLALVHGKLAAPRRIESLLVENRGDGLRGSHPSRGERAVTHVKPLQSLGGLTLIECRLETGRTHQIRIHLAEAGHPLAGETVYHRPRFGKAEPDSSGAPRILLHAGELGFRHPLTREVLHFKESLPEDFRAFVDRLSADARLYDSTQTLDAPPRKGRGEGPKARGAVSEKMERSGSDDSDPGRATLSPKPGPRPRSRRRGRKPPQR